MKIVPAWRTSSNCSKSENENQDASEDSSSSKEEASAKPKGLKKVAKGKALDDEE